MHCQRSFGFVQGNPTAHSNNTLTKPTVAQNTTATICDRPIRDRTYISPIITGVSGGAALFSVAARCYIVGKGFALDDFFAVLAFISAIPLGVMQFLSLDAGNGRDTWTVTPENITLIMKVCEAQFCFLKTLFALLKGAPKDGQELRRKTLNTGS